MAQFRHKNQRNTVWRTRFGSFDIGPDGRLNRKGTTASDEDLRLQGALEEITQELIDADAAAAEEAEGEVAVVDTPDDPPADTPDDPPAGSEIPTITDNVPDEDSGGNVSGETTEDPSPQV